MNGIAHNAILHDGHVRERIARAFSRGATSYDDHAELQRHVADRLLDQLPLLTTPATLLDLGCGTGYCTQRLQQRLPAAEVVAIDLAEPMLQKTRTRCGKKSALLCGDAVAMPLHGDCIDLLFSSLTVQWCTDINALFREFQRVIRPGGSALVSTLGPRTLQELRAAWQHVDARPHSNRFHRHEELLAAIAAAGLVGELETELRIRYCESLTALAHELRGLGANTVATSQSPSSVSPLAFKKASAAFAQQRDSLGIPVSWEIFYLRLHKPE
jgi:malonyl-CoA O-methyltransferase